MASTLLQFPPRATGLPVVSQECASLHQEQLQRINRIDPRDWLAEAGQYLRGERRSLPNIEHLMALWEYGDSFRIGCDERAAVIAALRAQTVADARRLEQLRDEISALLRAAAERQHGGR